MARHIQHLEPQSQHIDRVAFRDAGERLGNAFARRAIDGRTRRIAQRVETADVVRVVVRD